jgi:DNA-binding beta-propeller fold protein YncE
MNKNITLFPKIYLVIIILISVFMLQACFKQIAETRQPMPDIIWPDPPEIPRIRFVNSFSGPEELNIGTSTFEKFMRFFKGEENKSISNPYGITVDPEGRLYVVDKFNKIIHVLDEINKTYYTFPEGKSSLISPIGIALDNRGNVYVSDSKRAVVEIYRNRGKTYTGEIGRGLLNRPTGLSFNTKTEELLVVDTKNSEIIRYNINDYTVKGTIGKEGDTAGLFHNPTNIFTSRDGKIFVTDSLNFRIQVLTSDGQFIRSFGQAGDSPGYFSRPRGLAVDSDGNIYVVDALFDNIQIFDAEGRLLMAFGRPGNDYGEFWLPSGLFIDSNDRIYVSDSYNKRIQVFQYMKGNEFIKE